MRYLPSKTLRAKANKAIVKCIAWDSILARLKTHGTAEVRRFWMGAFLAWTSLEMRCWALGQIELVSWSATGGGPALKLGVETGRSAR